MSLVKQCLSNLDQKVETLRGEGARHTESRHRLTPQLPTPMCTVEQYNTFDTSLSNDPKTKESIIQAFITCGGDSVVEFTGRALRKIFSEELATKFSLRGQKGNIDFSATNTWNVLKDAVLLVRKLNATEKSIEKAVSEWFRHSNERLQKKIKKSSGAQNATTPASHDL
ncbi:unnamed protein product [Orchesella dallaii]|uniref:DUF4806 domain-containing protein n=1 Tax=Orchesella dallaii TaxID=48710 RepID=A0ABP1QCJ6_9HEXA